MKSIIFYIPLILIISSCSEPTTPPDNGPDTTSHNFTWQVDTLGDRSSYLNDVFILDENNIYAVGEIHKKNENDIDSVFSLAHWNGQKWKLQQVYMDNGRLRANLQGIWTISENDMWFASGSVYHWNGQVAEVSLQRDIYSDEIYTKLWYNNDSDIYAVGYGGYIAHYDGTNWTRLESGTDLAIQDIWGGVNKETGETEILAVASERFNNMGNEVLQIEGQLITALPDSGLPWSISSVWFDPEESYYITGDGVFNKRNLADSSWRELDVPPMIYKEVIRGNNSSDVFIAGSFGILLHYNGRTWKYYNESEPNLPNCLWLGLAVNKHIVVAVGTRDGQAIIARGYRN